MSVRPSALQGGPGTHKGVIGEPSDRRLPAGTCSTARPGRGLRRRIASVLKRVAVKAEEGQKVKVPPAGAGEAGQPWAGWGLGPEQSREGFLPWLQGGPGLQAGHASSGSSRPSLL